MTDNAKLIAWLRVEADNCPSAYHADRFNTCAAALASAEQRVKEAEAARDELIRNLTAADDDAVRAEQACKEFSTRLAEIEFSANGYCPACSGWEAEKGRGCTPNAHMKGCWLKAAILTPPDEEK